MRRVEVRWLDSCAYGRWEPVENVRGAKAAACISIGFLADENEEAITIVQSIAADENDSEYGQPLTIPRSAIVGELRTLHAGGLVQGTRTDGAPAAEGRRALRMRRDDPRELARSSQRAPREALQDVRREQEDEGASRGMTARDRLAAVLAPPLLDALDELIAERVAAELDARPSEGAPQWLTLEQAAERLGCSSDAVRMRASRGRLEARRHGRRLYVAARSVAELAA
jgi:excisionase family DNA binding protein